MSLQNNKVRLLLGSPHGKDATIGVSLFTGATVSVILSPTHGPHDVHLGFRA